MKKKLKTRTLKTKTLELEIVELERKVNPDGSGWYNPNPEGIGMLDENGSITYDPNFNPMTTTVLDEHSNVITQAGFYNFLGSEC